MSSNAKSVAFAKSMRGQFIISQALCTAIDTMKKVEPEVMQEQSNIDDMQYLVDNLFPMYAVVQKSMGEVNPVTFNTTEHREDAASASDV